MSTEIVNFLFKFVYVLYVMYVQWKYESSIMITCNKYLCYLPTHTYMRANNTWFPYILYVIYICRSSERNFVSQCKTLSLLSQPAYVFHSLWAPRLAPKTPRLGLKTGKKKIFLPLQQGTGKTLTPPHPSPPNRASKHV